MNIRYKRINEYNFKYNNFYNEININKKNKIDKIKNNNAKKLSILGEYLLKELIEEYYHINYKELCIEYNDYNKAYITNYNIYFNISHSYEYVVCITSNKECGIDIEKIKNINISTIKQFANEKELKYILSNEKDKRAFEIFCLKEAYFKMKGTGIQDFKKIEFTILNNKIICNDTLVECNLIYDIPNYIIAVCKKNEE